MLHKIIPFLSKQIPSLTASKALSKIDPSIKKFLGRATAAGYTIEHALDYLRGQANYKDKSNLRPDERAANERVRQSNAPVNALKAAGSVALGATALGMIPDILGGNEEQDAMKGELLPALQSKQQPLGIGYQQQKQLLSPQMAGYERQAQMPQGPLPMGFQRSQRPEIQEEEVQQQQKSKSQQRNYPFDFLESIDENLSSIFREYLSKGKTPKYIASLLKRDKRFSNSIKKFESVSGTPFEELVLSLFKDQGNQSQQSVQQQPKQPQPFQFPPRFNQALDKLLSM